MGVRTYEEMYGVESAARLRGMRAEVMRKTRKEQGKLPIDELLARTVDKVSRSSAGGVGGSRSYVKKRLIDENVLKNECAICEIRPEWQGAPLVLQLDHKDGKRKNWSIENLRLLCPNCHSQTPTFTGRNRPIK